MVIQFCALATEVSMYPSHFPRCWEYSNIKNKINIVPVLSQFSLETKCKKKWDVECLRLFWRIEVNFTIMLIVFDLRFGDLGSYLDLTRPIYREPTFPGKTEYIKR